MNEVNMTNVLSGLDLSGCSSGCGFIGGAVHLFEALTIAFPMKLLNIEKLANRTTRGRGAREVGP